MKCTDIRDKVSGYIDGTISPEEIILIEGHLEACQECKEYFADMRKTVDYVHNLEEIEPPAWLTRKVMAKIRSEAIPKKGIVQRLFSPLYIKLPLQAAVAVLLAVTTLYVYKTMQPELKLANMPLEERRPLTLPQGKERSPELAENKAVPSQTGKRSLPMEGPGGRKEKAEEISGEPKREEQPRLFYSEKAPAPAVPHPEAMPSAGAVAKDSQKADTFSRSLKAKAPAAKKEEHLSLSVYVIDVENAEKMVAEAVFQSGGKIIRTASFEDKKLLVAELNANSLKGLLERLKPAGEVKEQRADSEGLQGTLRIEIEIVQFKK
jgi:hypothetical protein